MADYKTVDEYIAGLPAQTRAVLEKVREVIRENAPDAKEKLSYSMPTFWQGKNLIHYAAMKNHLGIYPMPEAIEAFADRLAGYKCTKGAIQFPWDKPVPYDLIADMTRFRVALIAGQ